MISRGIKKEQIGNHAALRGSTPEIGRALIDKNMARTVVMIRQSIAARYAR